MSSAITCDTLRLTRGELDMVRRMVRRCGVFDETDDVAQAVVAAFARYSRPCMVPPGHAPAEARRFLLSGFVRRQVARHRAECARRWARGGGPMRGHGRGEHASALEGLHAAAPSAEERILERSRITLLRAAVEELRTEAPELHAVMQGELLGVPIPLLAARLGIPVGTAYTRSRLGRKAVRERLLQWEDDELRSAGRLRLGSDRGARERANRI